MLTQASKFVVVGRANRLGELAVFRACDWAESKLTPVVWSDRVALCGSGTQMKQKER